MKLIFRILAAAVAASLVLVACDKQEPEMGQEIIENGDNTPAVEGPRMISVSFAGTKSVLDSDGLTPIFVAGDIIKVSNGSAAQDCKVSVSGGLTTITTSLEGALTAVYPSTAAQMDGNAIVGVLVSTVQDGTFASANICKAEIPEGETSALFLNQTAIFKIYPGAGSSTKYVEVITGAPEIANTCPTSSEFDKMQKIHVNSTSADPVFVSILVPSGLKVRDISFCDGNNLKTLKDNTTAIAVNDSFTVDNNNWSTPFIELAMTVNGVTRKYKWAPVNLGVESFTDIDARGDFFTWGEVEPHYTGSPYPGTINWKPGYETLGNVWGTYKYCDGTDHTLTKYCTDSSYGKDGFTDGKTVLEMEDDAANYHWGGGWRIPTKDELGALCDMCLYVYGNTGSHRNFGTAETFVHLPPTGNLGYTSVNPTPDEGFYWTSSLNEADPSGASLLYAGTPGNHHRITPAAPRAFGYAIRPICY